MDFERLSALLWRERELLNLLLFKAEEKQFIIVTNKSRWLPLIAREIEAVLQELRVLEVERAAQTEVIAAELGLDVNPSLRQIAQSAPAPWQDLLNEHHTNLLTIVTEIRTLSETNRGLLENGLSALNDSLRFAQEPSAGTYTAAGQQAAASHRAVTLDGAL